MFRHYGLAGQVIKVKKKHPASLESKTDPWAYAQQSMRVEMETPYFLSCTVLPHRHPLGLSMSTPYRVTLHKHDIQSGEIIINGGAIK